MSKFLSRKFLVSVLVIVSVILKQAFGVELSDSVIEQIVDAVVALLAALGYMVSEAKVDVARARLPQDGADLG